MKLQSAAALVFFLATAAGAQAPGYSAAELARERTLESALVSRASADTARDESRALSVKPHMAGTAQQAWTRDYVIAKMKSWGLETSVREYSVWMPHPVGVKAWRVSPSNWWSPKPPTRSWRVDSFPFVAWTLAHD